MTPIPGYFAGKCCEDPDHISNYGEEDYVRVLEDGLFESRKLTQDFTFRLQIWVLQIVGAVKKLRQLGDRLWDRSPTLSTCPQLAMTAWLR